MEFDDDGRPPVGHLGQWHRRAVYGALASSFAAILLEQASLGFALLGVTAVLAGTMILRFRRMPLRQWLWGSEFAYRHFQREYRTPDERAFFGLLATKTGSILIGLVTLAAGVGMIAAPVLGVGPFSALA